MIDITEAGLRRVRYNLENDVDMLLFTKDGNRTSMIQIVGLTPENTPILKFLGKSPVNPYAN